MDGSLKNTLHTMAKSMGKVPDGVKARGPPELPGMPCFMARAQEATAQAEEIVSPSLMVFKDPRRKERRSL